MITHDLDALAGQPCEACGPDIWPENPDDLRTYLIRAARNTAGADAGCGHWHAEHATSDQAEADAIADALIARHAAVDVLRLNPDRGTGFFPYRGINSGDHPARLPCCQPIDGPERSDFQTRSHPAGARCFFCGDLLASWTRVA